MARIKAPYTLIPRKLKSGRTVFYYRLGNDPSRVQHSTGETARYKAEAFAAMMAESGRRRGKNFAHDFTFGRYAEPYFHWDRCPHATRLRDDGKQISKNHVYIQRLLLEKHILKDPFARLMIRDISRDDVLQFRSRLREENGASTVNKVIGLVKLIYREALFREHTDWDPTAGIGNVAYERQEKGTFTEQEVRDLFPAEGLGPWGDEREYVCFFVAATTGMRRGEVLALRWRHLDFEERIVRVEEAWKSADEIGPPKWGHKRITPLPEATVERLLRYSDDSVRVGDDDLVFCYEESGERVGDTWWVKAFGRAMKKAGIDASERKLSPHSFRHSLNSHLRAAGYDPAKIRAALGWKAEVVQDGYTHWRPEHLKEQAELIDRIWD